VIQLENGRLLAADGSWTISRKGRRRAVASP